MFLKLIFEKDGRKRKAVEYRNRRIEETAEKAKKGEADDFDLRVADLLSLLNRDVKAGRRKEDRIIQPYQFERVIKKYLEENFWTILYVEEMIENLKSREREKTRRELLEYFEDYGKDWVKAHTKYRPEKLDKAGFENFGAFVEWAETEKN